MKTEELAKLLLEHIGYDVEFCLWDEKGRNATETFRINGIRFVGHYAGKIVILSSEDEKSFCNKTKQRRKSRR